MRSFCERIAYVLEASSHCSVLIKPPIVQYSTVNVFYIILKTVRTVREMCKKFKIEMYRRILRNAINII